MPGHCGNWTGRQCGIPDARLATVAIRAGLRGLVSSPQEVAKLKQLVPPNMHLVTPGIRTGEEKADDQARTLTPKEARSGQCQLADNWPTDLWRYQSAGGGGEHFGINF